MNIKKYQVSKSRFNAQDITANLLRNQWNQILFAILRSRYVVGKRITPTTVKSAKVFLRRVNELKKSGGIPMVVKYLKVCSVLLQQVPAGYVLPDITALGMRISRSKSGLPRLIPSSCRMRILAGDKDELKFWLTLVNLYRDLTFQGKLDLTSVTAPPSSPYVPKDFAKFFTPFRDLFSRGIDLSIQAEQGLFQLYTSGPQTLPKRFWPEEGYNTSPYAVYISFLNYLSAFNRDTLVSLLEMVNITNNESVKELLLWCYHTTPVKDLSQESLNKRWLWWNASPAQTSKSYDLFERHTKWGTDLLGKLSLKKEPAGKVRVFAMVDSWTQWVLKPLHMKLFEILRKHSDIDGTFNQLGPLKRVPFGKAPIFSFDLSSATDRLPAVMQRDLLGSFFGNEFSYHWWILATERSFLHPQSGSSWAWDKRGKSFSDKVQGTFGKRKSHPETSDGSLTKNWRDTIFLKYSTGQPMGEYGSWSTMALQHHFIAHVAAWISGVVPVGTKFTEYIILGDDFVLWNSRVAEAYLHLMKSLGVKVGLAKSVLSPKGKGLEFAKRTLVDGVDVSPIPFKEMSAAHKSVGNFLSFMDKYNISPLNGIRFLGYGYKVSPEKNNSSMKVLRLAQSIPKSFLELRDLFLTEEYFPDDYLKYFESGTLSDKRRSLLLWLVSECKSLEKRAKDHKWSLLGYWTGLGVAATGPWQTVDAKIILSTQDKSCELAFKALSDHVSLLTAAIARLQPYLKALESPFWDLSIGEYSPRVLGPGIVQGVKTLFDCTEALDRIQIQKLMNPSYVPSKSLDYLETERTIRMYNRWLKITSKVRSSA